MCTLGFEKLCFVLNHTTDYLEVKWMNDSRVERIPTQAIDTLLRLAHADSLGPDGRRTNLEYLEAHEAFDFLEHGLVERMQTIKREEQRQALDRIVRRIFAEGKCQWDAGRKAQLTLLLVDPGSVGIAFKIRERIHRLFCPVK